jgi:hypothetical protein
MLDQCTSFGWLGKQATRTYTLRITNKIVPDTSVDLVPARVQEDFVLRLSAFARISKHLSMILLYVMFSLQFQSSYALHHQLLDQTPLSSASWQTRSAHCTTQLRPTQPSHKHGVVARQTASRATSGGSRGRPNAVLTIADCCIGISTTTARAADLSSPSFHRRVFLQSVDNTVSSRCISLIDHQDNTQERRAS